MENTFSPIKYLSVATWDNYMLYLVFAMIIAMGVVSVTLAKSAATMCEERDSCRHRIILTRFGEEDDDEKGNRENDKKLGPVQLN